MADQKISALPANSSIDGTEQLPIAKGGSNFKESTQNIKDWARGLVISASTAGISFSTPSDAVRASFECAARPHTATITFGNGCDLESLPAGLIDSNVTLQTFTCNNHPSLTKVPAKFFDKNVNLTSLVMTGNALTQQSIDNIILSLNVAAAINPRISSVSVSLGLGTSAAPSSDPAVAAALDNLVNTLGWTINTN